MKPYESTADFKDRIARLIAVREGRPPGVKRVSQFLKRRKGDRGLTLEKEPTTMKQQRRTKRPVLLVRAGCSHVSGLRENHLRRAQPTADAMSERVTACAPVACASCPWRKSNAGKASDLVEHERYHWYSKANQRRLWRGLRHGERMTCHPTDSRMSINGKAISDTVQTRECTGAVILVQREIVHAQKVGDKLFRRYRRERPSGLTLTGIRSFIERLIFGAMGGAAPTSAPDLNDADVQYGPLGEWTPQ